MRYSFHGKVRATGQQVDGYVEAETSTEAIDRLADQGIIGVYSVRAEPKQPRNPVLLAGTPEFERAQFEDPANAGAKKRKSLPAPSMPVPYYTPVPMPTPLAPPAAAEPAAVAEVPAPVPGVSDGVMLQLVEKLGTLIGQMQKFLDRPAQVVYASGPAREGRGGGGGGGSRAKSKNVSDDQNSTLRSIFQNNLDLRRSLQKLADTVTPAPNGTPVAAEAPAGDVAVAEAAAESPVVEAAAAEVGFEPEPPPDGGSSTPEMIDVEAVAPSQPIDDPVGGDNDLPLRPYDEHARQAQPAA